MSLVRRHVRDVGLLVSSTPGLLVLLAEHILRLGAPPGHGVNPYRVPPPQPLAPVGETTRLTAHGRVTPHGNGIDAGPTFSRLKARPINALTSMNPFHITLPSGNTAQSKPSKRLLRRCGHGPIVPSEDRSPHSVCREPSTPPPQP